MVGVEIANGHRPAGLMQLFYPVLSDQEKITHR